MDPVRQSSALGRDLGSKSSSFCKKFSNAWGIGSNGRLSFCVQASTETGPFSQVVLCRHYVLPYSTTHRTPVVLLSKFRWTARRHYQYFSLNSWGFKAVNTMRSGSFEAMFRFSSRTLQCNMPSPCRYFNASSNCTMIQAATLLRIWVSFS